MKHLEVCFLYGLVVLLNSFFQYLALHVILTVTLYHGEEEILNKMKGIDSDYYINVVNLA